MRSSRMADGAKIQPRAVTMAFAALPVAALRRYRIAVNAPDRTVRSIGASSSRSPRFREDASRAGLRDLDEEGGRAGPCFDPLRSVRQLDSTERGLSARRPAGSPSPRRYRGDTGR